MTPSSDVPECDAVRVLEGQATSVHVVESRHQERLRAWIE